MFDYFDTYLWMLAGNVKSIITAVIFFAVTLVKNYFPGLAAEIKKRCSAELRWGFDMLLLTVALLLGGFFAWKDEHVARLKDEGTIQVRRHLTSEEKEKLRKVFDGHQSDLPVIQIAVVSTVESEKYASEFAIFFSDMKFNTPYLPNSSPSDDQDTGLMVGVRDPARPSDAAKLFIKLFLEAGFRFKEVKSPLDFDLFIGLPNNSP